MCRNPLQYFRYEKVKTITRVTQKFRLLELKVPSLYGKLKKWKGNTNDAEETGEAP